jgi:TATA-binding protein-associated factor Taf7
VPTAGRSTSSSSASDGTVGLSPGPAGRYFQIVQETDQAMQVRDLEQTVAAMRDALELKEQDTAERVQRAVAGAASECAELKATVRALREQLESERADHTAKQQETERLLRGELRELQETVQALRARLEENGA